MSLRVGFGYDTHQLVEGIPLFLGGIEVPHSRGAKGHSDGDALIHAICDALLGAANLRDIGHHFPDSSNEFKGIDSKKLLKKVMVCLSEKGYVLSNVDTTICLEKPKLAKYISEMQKVLSATMNVNEDSVSIKATTNEKMGFIGRQNGIAAYAVVLIEKCQNRKSVY